MAYYQSMFGAMPRPPFAAPIASLPPGYPGISMYGGFPQQPSYPYPFAPQPYAQPMYPTAYSMQPYMPQQQMYQQHPFAQMYGAQSPYAPRPMQQPYPQRQQSYQQHQQPYQQQPQQPQQPHQQPQYAQPTQQQTVGNVTIDGVGLPIVPGDMSLQFPQNFTVEEKILSVTRDSFYVRDQQGEMRYKVDGSFTIHEHKTMKDMHGKVLLRMRESRFKLREKITISSAQNLPLLTLEKASAFQIGSKRVHGYYGNRIGGNPAIIITGNFGNTQFKIANAHGVEIATIRRRKFSVKNMTTGQDTYEVLVNQGSPAFVCFLTVALDEIYED